MSRDVYKASISRQEHGQSKISKAAKASLSETASGQVHEATSTFNVDNEVIR